MSAIFKQVLDEFMDYIASRSYTLSNGRRVTFLIETWDPSLENNPSKYIQELHKDCSEIQFVYIQEAVKDNSFKDDALTTDDTEIKKFADKLSEYDR